MANVAEIEDDGQEPAAEAVARVAKETSAASTVGEGSRIMSWREWWWKSFSQLFITCLYQSIFMLVAPACRTAANARARRKTIVCLRRPRAKAQESCACAELCARTCAAFACGFLATLNNRGKHGYWAATAAR